MNEALTRETVELLQQLIRNQCVNDGTVASGQEVRTSDVLRAYLEGSGLDLEVYEPDRAPGRTSLVARIEGSDPAAPTLCLMGFGLFSRALTAEAMAGRFHGNDERIDVESLALTTQAWLDVCEQFLG
jgi:acetylornithine deacetylase/succinyl-diaminopimelate desuccinylase-like protein